MLVMPANSQGWFFHSLARETGRIGHLFSPNQERQIFPWFPYALDNGAFSCWDMKNNTFDTSKWAELEKDWKRLLIWSQCQNYQPRWAVVPDVIGNREQTILQWEKYARIVESCKIPLAVAVQDGMTVEDVRSLYPKPHVIAIGGTTEWKWETVEMWAKSFKRVHVLRCNSPTRLYELEALGVESCDGTGWNRGDRKQTRGLEEWARQRAIPSTDWLSDHTCRGTRNQKNKEQITFA